MVPVGYREGRVRRGKEAFLFGLRKDWDQDVSGTGLG